MKFGALAFGCQAAQACTFKGALALQGVCPVDMAVYVSLSTALNPHHHHNNSSIPVPGARQCKYTGQSVRALPIRVLTVGKTRSKGVQLIVDDYIDKLKCYCRIEDVQIRPNPKNSRDIEAQIKHEDMAFMHLIRSDDWVVMLDERGLDIESEQMAELIGDAGNTGSSSLLFCIGGPYGHGRQLRQRANLSIKLSSLVLNHQIALVVLMEQLYRAWTILKGQKYHH
ncbi:putative RNA methyltransferase At5g10620 isoform X2 [Actinidia eriantha]|uniref:putative RNA methyltransferase At5g10620 isoform X2 n=1 Tax=Actinidia eriantha TaxID=165200 RepID=UPI00258FB4C8|nr:putative RNA methyltransferase At5g10620 isoform X2 [Actinidia eriantha]